MAKFYAFYLPQFHPIPENDEWYGKGFTEWRSVASARPLYPGHYQPHIPADLGFYDIRLKDTVLAQIDLAKNYGVDGFLYRHYWFGNGKQLLENPFKSLVEDKSIDFHFAAAWGNASWFKKQWGAKGQDSMLIEQQYLGSDDYKAHFYCLIDAFKDQRYIRINGKLLFIIYNPTDNAGITEMISVWRKLNDFYFVGHDLIGKKQKQILQMGFDGIYDDNMLNIHHSRSSFLKALLQCGRKIHIPTSFKYKNAVKYMIRDDDTRENIFPVVVPNWDHTPRTGAKNIMFRDCKPEYFKQLVIDAIHAVKGKKEENQVIIIKSWNEWGEGNHMEPDLKYGRGYLEALKEAREEENV